MSRPRTDPDGSQQRSTTNEMGMAEWEPPPPMPLGLTCNCDDCCARRKARREWAEKNGTA